VEGYDDRSYGRAFADVYDDWYASVGDRGATVAALAATAGNPRGRILELGVGTGRLAIPLAERGLHVHGVDSSPEMLAVLAAKPGGAHVRATCGDMVEDLPGGPFDVVVAAYNTLFNLRSADRQQACFDAVASRLAVGGSFFVEAAVFEADRDDHVVVRSMSAEHVVLSVSRHDPERQVAEGHFVELRDGAPVRLRPWAIRWSSPAELDAMAVAAGLTLVERRADFAGRPFDEASVTHVSRYCTTVHTSIGREALSCVQQ
jgi:SAM-dependent methyltransferase